MQEAVGALGAVAVGLIGLVVFLVRRTSHSGSGDDSVSVSMQGIREELRDYTKATREHTKALSDVLTSLREATTVHAARSESNYAQLKEGIAGMRAEMGEAEKRILSGMSSRG